MKNLPKRQYLLFMDTDWHSMLASFFCKISWEKPHMAFVKIVGGIEIYNFRIRSCVHFYTNFCSYLISNSGLAKHLGQGAAAPRRRARSRACRPWRPRQAQPKAPPTEAAASLASAPRCASFLAARVSPHHHAVHAPRTKRTAGPTRALAVRASVATPPYHSGIFVVSTSSPSSTYLRSPGLRPPRPSPPVTAMRRRRVPPRQNSEHQRPLGEHALLPHGHGWHCKPPSLSRVFSVDQGHIFEVSVLCRVLGEKG
jgi:hypothetical protein